MIHSCYMCLWNTKVSSISPKPSPKTCHVPWGQIRLFILYHKQQHRSLQIHMCQCSLNQRAGIRPSQTEHELLCWNKGAGLRDKGVHLLSVLEYLDLIFLGDNIIPVRFIPLISQHYWTPKMHFISCFHLIFNPIFLSFSFFPTPPILYVSFSVFQWGAVVSVSVSYCSQKMLLACRVLQVLCLWTATSCCSTIYSSSFITVTWWTQPHHRDKETGYENKLKKKKKKIN